MAFSSFVFVISIKGWALTTGFKNDNSKIVRTQVASTVRKRNDFTTRVLLLVGPKGSGAELKKVKAICCILVIQSNAKKKFDKTP